MNSDTFKIAAWEIMRNLRNKQYLISLLITPLIMVIFAGLPRLLEKLSPFISSIMLGLIWAIWHFLLFFQLYQHKMIYLKGGMLYWFLRTHKHGLDCGGSHHGFFCSESTVQSTESFD